MKPRFWVSILIFQSAYSPLSIIFLIQDTDFTAGTIAHPWMVFSILMVSIFSCVFLLITVKTVHSSEPPVTVKSTSIRSGELINYSIPYMISFFVMDLGNLNMLLSFGFFMMLMYWLTMKTHNIFVNPILALMGYNLYNVRYERDSLEFEDLFLVKGDRLQVGETCRIRQISECLYLVTKRVSKR